MNNVHVFTSGQKHGALVTFASETTGAAMLAKSAELPLCGSLSAHSPTENIRFEGRLVLHATIVGKIKILTMYRLRWENGWLCVSSFSLFVK